jgi:hypothetical protein
MEIFKALCASFFNIQSSMFNSEVYFALGMGEASLKQAFISIFQSQALRQKPF